MDQEKEPKEMSFEEKLQSVQEMTKRIESGALPLEDAVKEYERGMKVLGELETELNDMNRRLTVLQNGTERETTDEDI